MKTLLIISFLLAGCRLFAQQPTGAKLRIYIDCQQVFCDLDFIRQQITVADFVRDRQTSDVHVLINAQSAGSGGERYTLKFIGQGKFSQLTDTCSFFTHPAQTQNDIRELMISQLRIRLVPFFLKAGQAQQLVVSFNQSKDSAVTPIKDKWNFWVFSMGGSVNFSGDKNYKERNLRGNVSASRTTDKSRVFFSVYNSSYKNTYSFDDSNGKSVLKTTNNFLEVSHGYVKSLGPKWSVAYEANYYKSTYDNLRGSANLEAGIEYNIFPYKASSSKFLVIRYELEAEKRKYLQETIYDKTSETLFSHELGVYASFTQPWGSISSYLSWYNFLHDASKNNLSFYANAELQLFKGFSLNFYGQASLINDQLSLAKGGATSEEVLLRLKALSTNFNYYTGIGLTYRFGSSYNNFVNPRFTNGR